MSRYSTNRAAETRLRIIQTAAELFRQEGINGVGIARLMDTVGLTAGGFYLHFKTREELVVEALKAAMTPMDILDPGTLDLLQALQQYLSVEHRDAPGQGCALASVADDVGRASDEVRQAYTERVQQRIEFFNGLRQGDDPPLSRSEVLLLVSSCVGALTLARAVSDEALSLELLAEVREKLAQLLG
jgi:TetR/AcrR family transcriptional repressor of nem operon